MYTPQLQADANINEGEFVEVVPFFGTLRWWEMNGTRYTFGADRHPLPLSRFVKLRAPSTRTGPSALTTLSPWR